MDKEIASSHKMKGMLDDDYTLYMSGKIVHEFDKHIYPGGQNLREELTSDQLSDEVKQRLLNATAEEHKQLARSLLKID